ncbi:MAG: hypothetical protein ACTSRG_14670 [Candidatus Helarchaeota archaeon]
MDTVGKAGFQLLDDEGDAIGDVSQQEIRDLFTNTQKNNSFKAFKKRIVRDYFIGANVYVYKVTELDANGNRSDKVT